MANQGSDDEVSKLFADVLNEGNPQEPAAEAAVDVATVTVSDTAPGVDLKEEQKPPICMPGGGDQQTVETPAEEPCPYICVKCLLAVTADDFSGLPGKARKVTCKSCNSKRSILSKMFGGWPIPEFEEMGPGFQLDMWRSTEANSGATLMDDIVRSLAQVKITHYSKGYEGRYMPLSYYDCQGFDIDDIENKCKDTQEHPVLGTTYRVNITQVSSLNVEETVRKRIRERLSKAQNPLLGLEDEEDEGDGKNETNEKEKKDKKDKKKKKKKNKGKKSAKKNKKHRKTDGSSSSNSQKSSSKSSGSTSSQASTSSSNSSTEPKKPAKRKPTSKAKAGAAKKVKIAQAEKLAALKAQKAEAAEAAKAEKAQKDHNTRQQNEKRQKAKQLQEAKKLATKTLELLTGNRMLVTTTLQALGKKAVALTVVVMAEKEAAMMTSEELVRKASVILAEEVIDDTFRLKDVTESKKALEKVLTTLKSS